MRSLASSLPVLLLLAPLAACTAEQGEDDVAGDESAITASCALGSSCPASVQLLQGRAYAGRPPANLRGDLEIASDQAGWDKSPRRFSQKTSRPFTYESGRVVLSGNAAGDAAIGIDDFFLFEVLDLQGRRVAAATLNAAPGIVKLDGQPVRALERTATSAGYKTFEAGAIDLASILPKDKAFRLRVSALDFAGAASATDVYLSVKPGDAPTAIGGRACTEDTQCGGGSAVCFIDQCMQVVDQKKTVWSLNGLEASYDAANELRVGYGSYLIGQDGRGAQHSYYGTWSNPTGGPGGGPWWLDRAPGRDPILASLADGALQDSFTNGGEGGPSVPQKPFDVWSFGLGRNESGTTFLVYSILDKREQKDCSILLSSKPAGGVWSSPERVATCANEGSGSLMVHVRADSSVDILESHHISGLHRYQRGNAIDGWRQTTLFGSYGHHGFALSTHGADGKTHLVIARSRPDTGGNSKYEETYLEIGDGGLLREINLGSIPNEAQPVHTSIVADVGGNVWLARRLLRAQREPSLVRIDPNGAVVERKIGKVTTGPVKLAEVAVASTGELAFVHSADAYQTELGLRRLVPIR
jgi:hypothetical protein